MKIVIGKVLSTFDDDIPALEIPGLGILHGRRGDNDFDFVELNRKQLLRLRHEIDRELEDGKGNME